MVDYVKVICNKLNQICEYKAKKIPILPETVKVDDIISSLRGVLSIPVGIEKETLEISTISLKNPIYNITGEDITSLQPFITGLTKMITKIQNSKCVLLDTLSILSDNPPADVEYDSGNCIVGIDKVMELISEKQTSSDENSAVIMITGISTLLAKLDAVKKGSFTTAISEASKLSTVKFIFIETIDNIKSLNYEAWYKANTDLSEGIWAGNGLGNQFTLKVTTNSRQLRTELEPNFGYTIAKGKATVVKLLEEE